MKTKMTMFVLFVLAVGSILLNIHFYSENETLERSYDELYQKENCTAHESIIDSLSDENADLRERLGKIVIGRESDAQISIKVFLEKLFNYENADGDSILKVKDLMTDEAFAQMLPDPDYDPAEYNPADDVGYRSYISDLQIYTESENAQTMDFTAIFTHTISMSDSSMNTENTVIFRGKMTVQENNWIVSEVSQNSNIYVDEV